MKVKDIFTSTQLLPYFFRFTFILSALGLGLLVYDFGYPQSLSEKELINDFYFLVLAASISATAFRYLALHKAFRWQVLLYDTLSVVLIIIVILAYFFSEVIVESLGFLRSNNWIKYVVLLTFIREFAEQNINYKKSFLNPAQLFIISFVTIILIGTLLLMLPNATTSGLSFLNALFTSTSAVCVTGLIVVDTGTYFTHFGQVIIITLIQLGGLGILTFASYFSYFFKGGSTYENQLVLSDINNSKRIGEVFGTLKRIIIITFSIEFIGGLLVYATLEKAFLPSTYDRIFFSIFHSVSSFCNAGFSTLTSSLYEEGFRYNYNLQLVILGLFIFGGLGFPIIVNVLKYLKYLVKYNFRIGEGKKHEHIPWILNLNSRITLVTTLSLTVVGTVLFYVSEYHNTLAAHEGFGKIVTALFSAATPRTAGFNTVDMGALRFSSLMLVLFLMWIGASPASTGGGIKTSTFAIATLNFLSLARGKERIEVYRREIADISVRRAFATISLSLVVIGTGIITISVFNNDMSLLSIAFECFSAYSTVGLSVGITAQLSVMSKAVIIIIMFIGRVSMLTLMIALFKKAKHQNYRYPTEEITIN